MWVLKTKWNAKLALNSVIEDRKKTKSIRWQYNEEIEKKLNKKGKERKDWINIGNIKLQYRPAPSSCVVIRYTILSFFLSLLYFQLLYWHVCSCHTARADQIQFASFLLLANIFCKQITHNKLWLFHLFLSIIPQARNVSPFIYANLMRKFPAFDGKTFSLYK